MNVMMRWTRMLGGIKCQNCGKEVSEDEVFATDGKTLCEDCYIDVGHRIRICDPWGERSKTIFRKSHGLEGTEGLTDLQKEIYEFIQTRGKATKMEIMEEFKLPATELDNQFAILRHCQLLKGRKEGDNVYIVLW
jgi:late competence protein required for DNA uptake (superfamily II DNA/RNA helicase)